jgi:hypothetical protein
LVLGLGFWGLFGVLGIFRVVYLVFRLIRVWFVVLVCGFGSWFRFLVYFRFGFSSWFVVLD